MEGNAKVFDFMEANLISKQDLLEKGFIGSIWNWEHWRNGELIDQWENHNLLTYEGLTHWMDVCFSGGTQIASWYIALFEDDFTPASNNTYAAPKCTESTAYDEANRPGWQEAGVVARVITNVANKASFTINATKTIYGGMLVGGGTAADTKGDTAGGGVLMAIAKFSGGKPVVDDDVIKITVTITLAGAGESSSSSNSNSSSSSSSCSSSQSSESVSSSSSSESVSGSSSSSSSSSA